MRRHPLSRRRRVPVRRQLPLLTLPGRHGSAFKPYAGIERDRLEVTDGAENLLVWGEPDANHTRCGVCGAMLYSVVRDGGYVHVAMGSLAETPSIRPEKHIFVGSKADWFDITDDLPRFEGYPE